LERSRREELARTRRADELAHLPAWNSPALWAPLRADDGALSLGALVALVRLSLAHADHAAAQELFVLLLQRMARNRRWAAHTVRRTPSVPATEASGVREDLKQELTRHLWQRIAVGGDAAWDAWELYFQQALAYAQRHAATAYMEHNGYSTPSTVATPTRMPAVLVSRLGAYLAAWDDERQAPAREPAAAEGPLTVVELSDLRDLVERLPRRERAVVVMRFWLAASEREIAAALGVTTRTVRKTLARASIRLRAEYADYADEPPSMLSREDGRR
jgi:RNA polymerase sigma factor (sigma-70 family)